MITTRDAAKLGFGSVLDALERSLLSPMGADKLRAMRPSTELDVVETELRRTDELQQALERGDTLPFEDFLDVRDALERVTPDQAMLDGVALEELRRFCRACRRVRACLIADPFGAMRAVARRLTTHRALEDEISRIVNPSGEVRERASQTLSEICRTIRERQRVQHEQLRAYLLQAVKRGIAAEARLTLRAGRLVIPLRAHAKRQMPGFIHDTSASGQTVYLEPAACLEIGNEIRILEARKQREIERILRAATSVVRGVQPALRTNVDQLGTIDLVQAKARVARRMHGMVPRLSGTPILDIRCGRSPTLLLHKNAEEVVPMDLFLDADTRTLVITGPNAGGKTVTLKTAGLLCTMVFSGIPVPVHPASVFGRIQRIHVEIGDEQSIEQDLSTFSARIAGLRTMCRKAGPGVLLLVDEIGTGTDPEEGAALAQAVLEYFTSHRAFSIVTTHLSALKAYASRSEHVSNASMDFECRTLQPTFAFRQGVPGESFAFSIARRMELDDGVLDRAQAIRGQTAPASDQPDPSGEPVVRAPADTPAATVRAIRPPAAELTGQIGAGETVFIDDSQTAGEVIAVDGQTVTVLFGNLRMRVNQSRLTVANTAIPTSTGRHNLGNARRSIDLRGWRVREATAAVDRLIDRAIRGGVRTLEILHGKGTGALREAVHELLKQSRHVSSHETPDANPGVTYVHLK